MTAALYAVFGNPVAHSRSPEIHALFAAQQGVALHYQRRQVATTLTQALRAFAADGGRGANVTVPCKQEAFVLCSEHAPLAVRAGAVNTLIRLPDVNGQARWRGDNTDGIGLVGDIGRFGVSLRGARVLLLGAGGAVCGVLPSLMDEMPLEVVLCNRTFDKAWALADSFGITAKTVAQLIGHRFDVVINGTSASLVGASLAVSDELLGDAHLVYDMMYASQETAFLARARALGARQCVDGLGMLVMQAAASYALWQGFVPDVAPVLQIVRERLNNA